MLKIIAIVIAVAIAAVLGFAATRPNTFRVQREIDIKAPPEKVFALINDFHRWTAWSPWEKRDPAMKRAYGGPANGKGANYAWDGSREVGAGRMEIVDSTSPSRIQIQLDFFETVRSAQHGGIHAQACRRCDARDLGHVWPEPIHLQGDGSVFQYGRDDRQGL